jgi:hypothetical protein
MRKELTTEMQELLNDLVVQISDHPFIYGCKRDVIYRIFNDNARLKVASLTYLMKHYKIEDGQRVYGVKGLPGDVTITLNATMNTWIPLQDAEGNYVLVDGEIQGIPEYLYFVNLAKNAPIEFYNIVIGSLLQSDGKGNLNDYSRGNTMIIS